MSSNQRLILAVVLSTVVLAIGWFVFPAIEKRMSPKKERAFDTSTNAQTNEGVAAPSGSVASPARAVARSVRHETVTLQNEKFAAMFDNDNAALVSHTLKEHFNADGTEVEMIERTHKNLYPFTLSFTRLSNLIDGVDTTRYRVESKSATNVTFVADIMYNGNPIRVRKIFSIHENDYAIDFDLQFENLGGENLVVEYTLLTGSGLGPYPLPGKSTQYDRIAMSYLPAGQKDKKDIQSGHIANNIKFASSSAPKEWIAVDNRYFVEFFKLPNASYAVETAMYGGAKVGKDHTDNHTMAAMGSVSLGAKQFQSERFQTFFGPKERKELKTYNNQYERIFHEKFLFFSLTLLTDGAYWLLNFIYRLVKNYGLAIIIITILYKLVTWPLTQRSYDSMKKMQMLQPKMKALQEQYKNHPEKLNEETMNLYKREKINPLSGCLPMLLPFPLIIAFFNIMQNMVELRNVSFLWITDLTSPDRLFSVAGFDVNILPILMAITSVLSMLVQPQATGTGGEGQAKQMRMMNMILPVIFLFFFYNFASGLVLYWTTLNILNLVQQLTTKYFKKEKLVSVVQNDKGKAKKK